MRRLHPAKTVRSRHPIVALPLAISVLLLAAGCGVDAPSPSEPPAAALDGSAQPAANGGQTIVVDDVAELVAAMSPEHAGSHIVVRAGSYLVSQPLVVPDGATLGFQAVWEAPVAFGWTFVRIAEDGSELSRVDVPFQERATEVEARITELQGARAVAIVGTYLDEVSLAHPFDPDVTPFEPNGVTVYLVRL